MTFAEYARRDKAIQERPKNIVYFCVEDSRVKAEIDRLGKVITIKELSIIQEMGFRLNLDYSTGLICQEGSQIDAELSRNPIRKGTNHRYDVKREVNVFEAQDKK